MNEICEVCEKSEGKKYTEPRVKKLCKDCWKKLGSPGCWIVDLCIDEKCIGTYLEVKSE